MKERNYWHWVAVSAPIYIMAAACPGINEQFGLIGDFLSGFLLGMLSKMIYDL